VVRASAMSGQMCVARCFSSCLCARIAVHVACWGRDGTCMHCWTMCGKCVCPHLECDHTHGVSNGNVNTAAAEHISSTSTRIHRLPTTDRRPKLVCARVGADCRPRTTHYAHLHRPPTASDRPELVLEAVWQHVCINAFASALPHESVHGIVVQCPKGIASHFRSYFQKLKTFSVIICFFYI
jgi:hypothetical protein